MSDNSDLELKSPYKRGNFSVVGRSKPEKIISVAVVVMILVALFFAYYQLASSFKKPFVNFSQLAASSNTSCSDGSCSGENSASEEELKNTDTDGDGLSDYDELNVYKTSPYLEDTDSDGTSDKQEVQLGYDPNCPGKNPCFGFNFDAVSQAASTTAPSFQIMPSTPVQQITPDFLRQQLKASGATEEQLAQFSDAELLAMYEEYVAETGSQNTQAGQAGSQTNSGGTGTNNSLQPSGNIDLSQLNVQSVDDLKKLTGAQIRQLMIQQGAPAETLSQVSDDKLKEMFLAQLESKLSETNTNK